ncbi:hypothetical protein J6590_029503 [Homalodisca vitripennis]|nr:hypothetical protein J6590_029503 [Homalodisca vitripennis]
MWDSDAFVNESIAGKFLVTQCADSFFEPLPSNIDKVDDFIYLKTACNCYKQNVQSTSFLESGENWNCEIGQDEMHRVRDWQAREFGSQQDSALAAYHYRQIETEDAEAAVRPRSSPRRSAQSKVARPARPGCESCCTTNEPAIRPHDLPNQRLHPQHALAVKGVVSQINRQFGPMTCLIKGRTTSSPWL